MGSGISSRGTVSKRLRKKSHRRLEDQKNVVAAANQNAKNSDWLCAEHSPAQGQNGINGG
jgi:hypothetical protein